MLYLATLWIVFYWRTKGGTQYCEINIQHFKQTVTKVATLAQREKQTNITTTYNLQDGQKATKLKANVEQTLSVEF